MKLIREATFFIMLLVNWLFIGLLLLSAYSPYIHPSFWPLLNCLGLIFPVLLFINICFIILWLLIRRRLIRFSLLALLLCLPQIGTYIPIHFTTQKIPENSIKLLTYNVMYLGAQQDSKEENPILQYIRKNDADIVCLQEFIPSVSTATQKEIDKALKAYPFKLTHRVGKSEGNGVACYSKYPILSSRAIKYNSQNNGSIVYEIKIDNDTLTLINNHLESNKLTREDKIIYQGMIEAPEPRKIKRGVKHLVSKLKEAIVFRSKQAESIAGEIEKTPHRYTVVCGDFNDSPISNAHHILTRQLEDAFSQSGCGLGISYNRNRFYFRIDHILISKNLQSYNCTVDRSIRTSDHYPVWCYISKKD